MQLKYISASRIKTYEQCQLKYHAIYDLKYPEGTPHNLTLMGRGVHNAFDNGVKEVMAGRDFNFTGATKRVCQGWGYSGERQPWCDPGPERLGLGIPEELSRCVGTEIAFFEALSDGETKIKGLIDRLDLNCPEADIIDLKTQSRAFEESALGDEWQTVVYNIAARKLYPDITGQVAVSYWVLRHRVQRVWVSMDDAKRGEDKLLKMADEIRSCTDPQPTVTPLCQWCPYRAECPAANESRKNRFNRKYK